MRHLSRAAFLFLLMMGACLAIGCGEKSVGPDDKLPPPAGKHLWSESFGDEDWQVAEAVAVDASGNVIVTGSFYGTVDFGGGTLTSAGNRDIFVVKFGFNGAHLWSERFGSWRNQIAEAVAADAAGNVIVAGHIDGIVDFGGGALAGEEGDIFIAKFGSDGAHLWSKRFGDASDQFVEAVAADASGNVIVTGHFDGTVDFGGGALTSAGMLDIFVVKFGSDGAHLWSRRFGDGENQYAQAIAVDASGNMIIAGSFYGAVDFGGGALTSAGSGDIFVAEFGSDGAHLWSKSFGDGDWQTAQAVAADASGNVIVTGAFWGTVDFGGGRLTSMDSGDVFVAKFGPDGVHLGSKRFGDGGYQIAEAVAVDASGNVIIAGSFWGTADFGGGTLTSVGDRDIFVAKFGPGGAHLWSKSFGDGSDQDAYAVAVDASGNVIITGYFMGAVDFGGDALTSAGSWDIFVAKFGR